MLERFLEDDTVIAVHLLSLLFDSSHITLRCLTKRTGLSEARLRKELNSLNQELQPKVDIQINDAVVSLSPISPEMLFELKKQLYQNSEVLQVMAYLLNHRGRSVTAFCQEHYFSEPTFYRLQRQCRDFLKTVGLTVHRGQICGQEYRKRYLVAALSCRYGIDCVDFDQNSRQIVKNFVMAANPGVKPLLDKMPQAFAMFDHLVALTWLRHDQTLELPDDNFWRAVCLEKAHQRLKEMVIEKLQPQLSFELTATDHDYLYLVYLTVANELFRDDAWSMQRAAFREILQEIPEIHELTAIFASLWGKELVKTVAFKEVVNAFGLRFMGGLQNLVIDYQLGDLYENEFQVQTDQLVQKIVKQWCQQNQWSDLVDDSQIKYFAHQLMPLIEERLPATPLYIFTKSHANYAVIAQLLRQEFGNRLAISSCSYFSAEQLQKINQVSSSLILADHEFWELLAETNPNNQRFLIALDHPFLGIERLRTSLYQIRTTAYVENINEKLSILHAHEG